MSNVSTEFTVRFNTSEVTVLEDEGSLEVCIFISVATEIDVVVTASTDADTATGDVNNSIANYCHGIMQIYMYKQMEVTLHSLPKMSYLTMTLSMDASASHCQLLMMILLKKMKPFALFYGLE